MDNYNTIARKLKHNLPFKGNTMSAYWFGNTYVVYSYNTLIAEASLSHRELDTRYFSATTSKHQRLITSAWGMSPLKAKKFRAVA